MEFDPDGYWASPSPLPLQCEPPEKKMPCNAMNNEKKNWAPKPVPCSIDISSVSDSNSSSYHQKQIEVMRTVYEAQSEKQRLQFEKHFAQLAQKHESSLPSSTPTPTVTLPSTTTNIKESRLPDRKKKK